MKDLVGAFAAQVAAQLGQDAALVEAFERRADANHEAAAEAIDRAGQNRLAWMVIGPIAVAAVVVELWLLYQGGESESFGELASYITCALAVLAGLGVLVADPFVPDEQAGWLRRKYGRLRSLWPRLRPHGKAMALAAMLAFGVQVMAVRHEQWERRRADIVDTTTRKRVDGSLAKLEVNLATMTRDLDAQVAALSKSLEDGSGRLDQLRQTAEAAYGRLIGAAAPDQTPFDMVLVPKLEALVLSSANPLTSAERERAVQIIRLSEGLMTILMKTQDTSEDLARELGRLAVRANLIRDTAVMAANASNGARDAALMARTAAVQAKDESAAARDAATHARAATENAENAARGASQQAQRAADTAAEARTAAVTTKVAVDALASRPVPVCPPPTPPPPAIAGITPDAGTP
jgi:hypothetical protein